ncbi:MAG: N-acetylmuramoyl-L-alanine amidase [Hyphomicrobiales bacterium]|nr:N-acetylmuramoyl-L-alanine amidase [Hyphomicrobiales bacterium]
MRFAAWIVAWIVAASLAFGVAPARAGDPPVAVAASVAVSGDRTILEFDMSAAVDVRAFYLSDPDRLVLDMPAVRFDLPVATGEPDSVPGGKAKGLVKSFRFGEFARGKSRVVIDLARPARLVSAKPARIAGAAYRLRIALAPVGAARFAALARKQAPEPGAKPAKAAKSDRPVIMLDPGHGGIDSGAVGVAGAVEKDIVLAFAMSVADSLRAGGRFKVEMTRTDDSFVPLDKRVELARAAGAALMISIHADSLPSAQGVAGATIYTAAAKASDKEAARMAARENGADAAGGIVAATGDSAVNGILFDLTRRETATYSRVFSRDLAKRMAGAFRMNANPERSAGFRVLIAPDVPSVLIELGYLSNADDVKKLRDPAWREGAAGAIASAVRDFFAPKGKPKAKADQAAR